MARSMTTVSEGEPLDAMLQSLFRAVQAQALPESLRSVVEQLREVSAEPVAEPA